MRILLLGEYSNVHWNLAEGLRQLGHEVCVISDGDEWKNYHRDIDLSRHSTGRLDTVRYIMRLLSLLPKMRNYDVVQIINPVFLLIKADKILPFYRYLRHFNQSVFMGAFGMDHYWVKTCMDCHTFRYSDFNLGATIRYSKENDIWIHDWLKGDKGQLNIRIAQDCDGIIAGLYEYYKCYEKDYWEKMDYIPFPIQTDNIETHIRCPQDKVRFFIGIQKQRNAYKGTDIMLQALEMAQRDYPDHIEIVKVESVPFLEYRRLLANSDVMLDQLYSYTPAMNALTGMAQGLVIIGGGEPEAYELMGDYKLRPVVNVLPDLQSVYHAIVDLAIHPEKVRQLSERSIAFIHKYHDRHIVARKYLEFWQQHSMSRK